MGAWDGVARLLGRFPRFLTREEVVQIAGGPGVTLTRLLTDPADGRCVERSIASYRPDATMRRQLRAADVHSRFPGSTHPVRDGDLDHVVPYLLGGATAETQLQGLDRTAHILKTEGHWRAQMDATRKVTWTSFFGRLYPTRPHDYRQYLSVLSSSPTDTLPLSAPSGAPSVAMTHPSVLSSAPFDTLPHPAGTTASAAELTRTDQRFLASVLTYAALCARRAGGRVDKPGDDPDGDDDLVDTSMTAVWVRHRRPDGSRASGPRPGTPTPEALIAAGPRAVLAAAHWADLRKDAEDTGPSGPSRGDRRGAGRPRPAAQPGETAAQPGETVAQPGEAATRLGEPATRSGEPATRLGGNGDVGPIPF